MKHGKEIGIVINLPNTPEGMARLEKAVHEFNGRIIASALRTVDAPAAVKTAYLKSLNGVVPWANHT